MKKGYISPEAKVIHYEPQESVAVLSFNFSDFFSKTIDNELALVEDNGINQT